MSKLDKKTTGADDLGSVLQGVMRQALMQIEGMLPAVVTAVDRTAGRVSVKPLIMAGTAEGGKVARPVVANIPIMTMGAGGIYASFPVKVGDLGFVFSASRDTSLFYQSNGGEDWPNTERLHSFSDGGFLPLKLFNFSIAGGVLADGFSLQTDDGSTFVTLKEGEVQITATKVKIVGDIEPKGNPQQLGDVEQIGNVVQTGNNSIAGALTANSMATPSLSIAGAGTCAMSPSIRTSGGWRADKCRSDAPDLTTIVSRSV